MNESKRSIDYSCVCGSKDYRVITGNRQYAITECEKCHSVKVHSDNYEILETVSKSLISKLFKLDQKCKPVSGKGHDEIWCEFFNCSLCGKGNIQEYFKFCPDCGATIDWSSKSC